MATAETVIHCNSSVGIVMFNITDLIVTNITVRSCFGSEYNNATVLIKQCTNVQLKLVVIEDTRNSYGIVGINILGDSFFSYITNNAIIIIYNDNTEDSKNHSLSIDHYHVNYIDSNFTSMLNFTFIQQIYKVKVNLLNLVIQGLNYKGKILSIYFNNKDQGQSMFTLNSCYFANNHIYSNLLYIASYDKQHGNAVWLEDCTFFNNQYSENQYDFVRFIEVDDGPDVHIISCTFQHNHNVEIFRVIATKVLRGMNTVTIANTTFSSSTGITFRHFIDVHLVQLYLIGPVIFKNISKCSSVIKLKTSNITLLNYIEFVNITAENIICFKSKQLPNIYFSTFIMENTKVNVSRSTFNKFAFFDSGAQKNLEIYPPCYFQYLTKAPLDSQYNDYNYSVIFDNNLERSVNFAYNNLPITHCRWLPQSTFKTASPLEVNSKIIKYINQTGQYNASLQFTASKKKLCACDTSRSHDCYKDPLDFIYPGQTMTLDIYINDLNIPFGYSNSTIVTVVNDSDWLPPTACGVTNSSELSRTVKNSICTTLKYTISFPTKSSAWCELFLKGFYDSIGITDIYYIKALHCPTGFILENGICQCHPFLYQYSITCDINDQTLLRPANTWLSPVPHNNSYVYSLSLQCPFHYCLSHSSHFKFSNPDSQCQFNRSGILCGHCQHGLSTVFGSSQCQQCSSIYLFLIVPIAMAGLVLVLLLFILNLTVTDGTINAFIFYVNIISINTPVFFPNLSKFMPAYTFISLANLDLGIQTCFYNGMDDYAKMWLQLAFPFYLILIATLLIITSRYSTTIQRITARRALPVLATLFLLSYTKTLHIASSILFSYSKIIHLPSNHTTLVWSIDANVPLFKIRFVILFIVCLTLFFLLIPFNIILLFTRLLSRFRFIMKFKPLLDAYQGPYKIKFYYWTGVQLVIRLVFCGIASLDRNINLTISTFLLSIVAVIQAILQPLKVNYKNYNELIFILNLQCLYIILLYGKDSVSSVSVIIAIAAVHFSFIIIYHIITYVRGGDVKIKIEDKIGTAKRWLSTVCSKQKVEQFEFEEYFSNLKEFQEPLVGFET